MCVGGVVEAQCVYYIQLSRKEKLLHTDTQGSRVLYN